MIAVYIGFALLTVALLTAILALFVLAIFQLFGEDMADYDAEDGR